MTMPERALDHRRARCEERTPVATEGERFRRARGATIPAKSAAKLTPRPRDTRVSVLSFRSYWARLDAADVGPVQIGAFAQLLLGQTLSGPELAHLPPERPTHPVHD